MTSYEAMEQLVTAIDVIKSAEYELSDLRTENQAAQESINQAMRDSLAARMALIEAIRSMS